MLNCCVNLPQELVAVPWAACLAAGVAAAAAAFASAAAAVAHPEGSAHNT